MNMSKPIDDTRLEVLRRLKSLSASRGVSQAELARRLEMTPSRVGNYWQERRLPSLDVAEQWAQALGCGMRVVIRATGEQGVHDLLRDYEALAEEDREILGRIAAAMPHMPRDVKLGINGFADLALDRRDEQVG